jgi:hypothetical protein
VDSMLVLQSWISSRVSVVVSVVVVVVVVLVAFVLCSTGFQLSYAMLVHLLSFQEEPPFSN